MRFWTYTLSSGSLSIDFNDGALFVSLQSDNINGQCNVQGNIPFKGLNAQPISITAGQGINLAAQSPASPLDGITITWVAGTVDIVVGF